MKMHRQQTSDTSSAVNSMSSPAKIFSVPTNSHNTLSPIAENVSRLAPPPPVHVPVSQSNLSGIPTVHRSSTPQVGPTFQNETTAAAFVGGTGSGFNPPTPQLQQQLLSASNTPGLSAAAMHIQSIDTSIADYQNVCISKTSSYNDMETNNYPMPVGPIVLSADANNLAGEYSHLRSSNSSLVVSSVQGTHVPPPVSNQMYPSYQLPYSTQLGHSSAVTGAPQQQPNAHQIAPPPPAQVHVIDMSAPSNFPDAYQIHSSIFRR